jgi:hypothetical protein
MTDETAERRLMRLLAAILMALWALTAIAVASAYRPGGPLDILVAAACFVPVVIADAGFVWPPEGLRWRDRMLLVWVWIAAVLFIIPVLFGVAENLASDGPQSLVPSWEEAYAAGLALLAMTFFSVVGPVHRRLEVRPLEHRATVASGALALLLTAFVGVAFTFVAIVNDQALRAEDVASSRFGPTDPDLEPPFCDAPVALGANAQVVIEARSSLDGEERGRALLAGMRGGIDERWGGSWEGADGEGQLAYRRVGARAWLNETNADAGAPGSAWRETTLDPFGMLGGAALTMDGPPHAVADAPRGEIVAEDLGLVVIEGARARHCRTFIDGTTALDTFLPLRWLLLDQTGPTDAIGRWRGALDWWVFADGEFGMAAVEVSGSRAETDWDAEGVQVLLEARLEATERSRPVDVAAPLVADATSPPTLQSDAP